MPDNDCISCGEEMPLGECPNSLWRECGHHCNHSWTHDSCCWCGAQFGEVPVDRPLPRSQGGAAVEPEDDRPLDDPERLREAGILTAVGA